MRHASLPTVLAAAVLSLTLAAAAGESNEPGVLQVSIAVGETKTLNVGGAIGAVCDDLSLVTPQMKSGENGNELVVTGLKEGNTLCRAGTIHTGSWRFVRVTVTAAHDSPTPKKSE